MGRPKFGLKLPEGKSFLEHLVMEYYNFGCEEIIVVINMEALKYLKESPLNNSVNLKWVVNQTPESGRFGSVQCGVKALKTKNPVFIHNVDNPYARRETLKKLSENHIGFDFAKPVFDGKGGHPILIGEKIIQAIMHETRTSISLRSFLKQFSLMEVDVKDPNVLININSIEEYQQFFKIQIIR
ncbi:MAG: NTP transferase domain-containing protein [Bacteroidales bacterium]|nr:NTP transferase domain-containing protein [Bacteroidales bacterium]